MVRIINDNDWAETSSLSNYSSFVSFTQPKIIPVEIPEDLSISKVRAYINGVTLGSPFYKIAFYDNGLNLIEGDENSRPAVIGYITLNLSSPFIAKRFETCYIVVKTSTSFVRLSASNSPISDSNEPLSGNAGALPYANPWPSTITFNPSTTYVYGALFVKRLNKKDIGHVLRLIYGNDPSKPKDILDLSGFLGCDLSDGNIAMPIGGFVPPFPNENIIYQGQSIFRNGQRRGDLSNYDNIELPIMFDTRGGSATDLENIKQSIAKFITRHRIGLEEYQGQKVWVQYRWADNLKSLPEPVLGQFSHFYSVQGFRGITYGSNLHSGALAVGDIDNNTVTIITLPFTYGVEREAMRAIGPVELTNRGIKIHNRMDAAGTTPRNFIQNPAFAASPFNSGWTATTDLRVIETRDERFFLYQGVSAKLVNRDNAIERFTTTATLLNTNPHYFSCFVKLPDGSPPSSSNIVLYNSVLGDLATSFQNIHNDGWYLAYTTFTPPALGVTIGVTIFAKQTDFVDGFQISEKKNSQSSYPYPYIDGEIFGADWSGTRNASNSIIPVNGVIGYENYQGISGDFTLAMWFSPDWDLPSDPEPGAPPAARAFLSVYFDTDNRFFIFYESTSGWNVQINTPNGNSVLFVVLSNPLEYGGWYHIVLSMDASFVSLYINGELGHSQATLGMLVPGGFLSFGGRYNNVLNQSINGTLDGIKIWNQSLTPNQVQSLYLNEKYVKDRQAILGVPPYLWVDEADFLNGGNFIMGTRSFGYLVVNGEYDAYVKWKIQLATVSPSRVYFVGRRAVDDTFLPSDSLNDAALAALSPVTPVSSLTTLSSKPKSLPARGQNLFAGAITISGTSGDKIDIAPAYQIGDNNIQIGRYNTVTLDGGAIINGKSVFYTFNDWDMVINWPDSDHPVVNLKIGYAVKGVSTNVANITFTPSSVFLTPWPWFRTEVQTASMPAIASGDYLLVDGFEAYLKNVSTGYQMRRFNDPQGGIVTAIPHKYNYIVLTARQELQNIVNNTVRVIPLVTPRYYLGGGEIS